MDNLNIYNKVRAVPPEAQKNIGGGRLKGMTDINPMWRIKTLTEVFGMVGFGWRYEIIEKWTEEGGNNEVSAFVRIKLYVKQNEQWSEAIEGIGGSSFVTTEKNGLYTSDECYKMALTDSISVACKAIGIGADVYYEKDKTKYTNKQEEGQSNAQEPKTTADKRRVIPIEKMMKDDFLQALHGLDKKNRVSGKVKSIFQILEQNYVLTTDEIKQVCHALGEFEKRTNQVLI